MQQIELIFKKIETKIEGNIPDIVKLVVITIIKNNVDEINNIITKKGMIR